MTKIKLKIVLTCLCSVALILCTLLVVVNVVVPKSLENQAKKAIEQEIGENHDDEKSGMNFLRSSVAYLEIGGANEDLVYLTETEQAVLAFCDDKKPVRGEFYRMKDKTATLFWRFIRPTPT